MTSKIHIVDRPKAEGEGGFIPINSNVVGRTRIVAHGPPLQL